jgi:hypothetical protein
MMRFLPSTTFLAYQAAALKAADVGTHVLTVTLNTPGAQVVTVKDKTGFPFGSATVTVAQRDALAGAADPTPYDAGLADALPSPKPRRQRRP